MAILKELILQPLDYYNATEGHYIFVSRIIGAGNSITSDFFYSNENINTTVRLLDSDLNFVIPSGSTLYNQNINNSVIVYFYEIEGTSEVVLGIGENNPITLMLPSDLPDVSITAMDNQDIPFSTENFTVNITAPNGWSNYISRSVNTTPNSAFGSVFGGLSLNIIEQNIQVGDKSGNIVFNITGVYDGFRGRNVDPPYSVTGSFTMADLDGVTVLQSTPGFNVQVTK